MTDLQYENKSSTFYEDQTDQKKVGRFRAWYHRSRFVRLRNFIKKYYKDNSSIADFGCGNCLWNDDRLPVIGVDINESMLRRGVETERLKKYFVCHDLSTTPLATSSLDTIVMSEVLEHVTSPENVLSEIHRVLNDNGVLLLTVPWDFFGSPFYFLFNLNCLYQGYVRGSHYHRLRCGHIHHFTKSKLKKLLENSGFTITEIFVVNGFLIYCSAQKI